MTFFSSILTNWKLGIGLIAIGVLVSAAAVIIFNFGPADSQQLTKSSFVVPRGQAVSRIAERLADQGLIKSSWAFRLIVKKLSLEDQLQAGSFQLSPSMTLTEIAHKLTEGTNDTWVTIPEGWRREEVATSLAVSLPAFDEQAFLNLSLNDEGRLFPDTYLFAKESTAQTVYSVLINTFENRVETGLATEITAADHDFNDVLIMASIVEREARGSEEMRHVAGILWNRIELGMALQADATLQYAAGYDATTDSWWTPPTAADKQLSSLFNTYQYPGLPPHPIASPGLVAISAALDPLSTTDLYYLHDRRGEIHYAQTLDEHNANVQRYLR